MSDTNLSNSVILPREDFVDLQTAAWDRPATTAGERVGNAVSTFVFFGAAATAVGATAWAIAKANDWKDRRAHERMLAEKQFNIDNGIATK